MLQSTGEPLEIPSLARKLSEDELTFLDDVPQYQVDELKDIQSLGIQKWYMSNPHRVMSFDANQFEAVAAYFDYLKQIMESP